jgi:hypothetical protein
MLKNGSYLSDHPALRSLAPTNSSLSDPFVDNEMLCFGSRFEEAGNPWQVIQDHPWIDVSKHRPAGFVGSTRYLYQGERLLGPLP